MHNRGTLNIHAGNVLTHKIKITNIKICIGINFLLVLTYKLYYADIRVEKISVYGQGSLSVSQHPLEVLNIHPTDKGGLLYFLSLHKNTYILRGQL